LSAYPGQELFSFAGPLALAVREGGGIKKQVEWLANVIYLSIYLLFSKQSIVLICSKLPGPSKHFLPLFNKIQVIMFCLENI
jgi:hypothetical protein